VSARRAHMHMPTSTLEAEYRRKRVRCDCAHASIWGGLAQVWLLMAVDVKVRRAGARARGSCDGSLPCQPGAFPTYGPSSHVCASTFRRQAQRGIPGIMARVAEDGEGGKPVRLFCTLRETPGAGHHEYRVRTGQCAEQCDGHGSRICHTLCGPIRPLCWHTYAASPPVGQTHPPK
jgi:hypothetical protein